MEIEKLTPLEFCILVTWLHGWTIKKIHLGLAKRHGKSEHAVRGVINKLPKRRQEMSQRERQEFLDCLKNDRADDGMLPAEYFIAKKLASDQTRKVTSTETRKPLPQPDPPPDPKTRAGRREIARRKKEEVLRAKKREEAKIAREAGNAPRGVDASPLEFLYHNAKLTEPETEGDKTERANNAMRRYEAGVRLRAMMESIYGSGVKSVDHESAGGGGGPGVVIHAVVAENIKNVGIVKSMMTRELFIMLDQLLMQGLFVWQIPSQKGSDIVLSEIREALDITSKFFGMMPSDRDEVPRRQDRRSTRKSNREANEAIAMAQRQAK